jgi:hypothetical protein
MTNESKKSKIKTPTPEFLILSERLKEAAKLKLVEGILTEILIN